MIKLQTCVLCGLVLFLTTIATPQSLEELVQTKNWTAVKTESANILKTDPQNALAHYALGLALHAEDSEDEQSIEHLEKALKIDPTLLDAYLLVARIYQEKTSGDDADNIKRAERWLEKAVQQDSSFVPAWLDLVSLLENDLKYDRCFSTLCDGLLKNPLSFDLYDAFRKKTMWYEKFEEALPVLNELIQKIDYNHTYIIQKAEIYFRQGKFEQSTKILDSLQHYIYKDTKAQFYLLRAKLFFEDYQDEDGLQYYWKAVAALIDSASAQLFLNDVCYIMLSSEYQEYKSLNNDEYPNFFTQFWRKRDPDLSTRTNERIAEHYRRLYYARQNFRRFTDKRYNETILERDHYHAGSTDMSGSGRTSTVRNASSGAWIKRGVEVKVGDDFMDGMVSEAVKENRDVDDLGLIYIKHGQWDDWETATLDQYNVVTNKTVQYYRTPTRPEMLFHFVKSGEVRGWCIESLPHYFINRGRFGADYARVERSAEMNRRSTDYEFEEYDLNTRLIEQTTHDAQIAVSTETSDYTPPGEPIALPTQFLFFKDNDKVRMEWYFLLMGDRIGIESDGETQRFNFSKSFSLFDAEWNEVLNSKRDELLPIDMTAENWNQFTMVRREQVLVTPGTYICQTQIHDNVLDNSATARDTLVAPDFADSLCMSDILLSSTIVPASETSQFIMHDLQVRPHMFWAFDKKEPIGIYFEVYNLSPSASGKSVYDVTCTIIEKEPKNSILKMLFAGRQKNVSLVNEYESNSTDDTIYINFNFEKQKKGLHNLIVEITDKNSNQSVSKTVEIDLY